MKIGMRPLVMALVAAVCVTGCSNGSNEFAGDYAGIATDDNYYYALEATVANDGSITGLLYVYDGSVAPPLGTNFPGSDYGDVLGFTGKVDGDNATVTTTGGEFTIAGAFGADGVFKGTIDQDGADPSVMNFVAATPVTVDDDISVACGDYSFVAVTSAASGDKVSIEYYGDSMFLTNGTDTFGFITAGDGSLTGIFSGALGDNLCPAGGYCNDFTGTIAADWDGDAIDFDVTGTAEVDSGASYNEFYVSADMVSTSYSGGLSAYAYNCYSWDYAP